ncbi:Solute carrier family 22 member 7 [Phytophthora nicotianae]|uniref:Solute carrier family 22 member 7 n=1 Tax=Phytophthora nicotianae TaxID=4792 RepID=A0A0W8AYU5_PHYNI|nr:Solute carrier family 22 member 7 [Phytophthora nicotianae]
MTSEASGSARLLRIEQLRHVRAVQMQRTYGVLVLTVIVYVQAIANISDGVFQLRAVLCVAIIAMFACLLAAAIFAGMFTGGLLFGSLSDRIGRRKSLLYSLLLNGIFGLLSALSPNVYALIAFRTCAGIAIVSLPSFVCWMLTYKYVPESAQFFARRRLLTDAEMVVDTIKTTNGDAADHVTESSSLLSQHNTDASEVNGYTVVFGPSDPGIQTERSSLSAYGILFDPVLRGTTISLLMSWFCLSFGSYGLATWITMLFKRIGLENPFANAFIYAAANLPGNIMTALLMDRLGGRRILAISMLLSAGCATGFAYANSSASGAAAIVLLASGFNAFSTAGWNAIDLMSAESFPTDVRTTGMGTLSAAGRAGSVAAQFVNGYLIGPPVHVTLLLAITASMMLLGTISSVLVRDYSNKALPESVEEMRRTHEKINNV